MKGADQSFDEIAARHDPRFSPASHCDLIRHAPRFAIDDRFYDRPYSVDDDEIARNIPCPTCLAYVGDRCHPTAGMDPTRVPPHPLRLAMEMIFAPVDR